jgi:adenylate cyclase
MPVRTWALPQKLAAAIDEGGHSVWWDHDIQGGTHFVAEIDRELKSADAVVVLWSATSTESPWVQDEAAEDVTPDASCRSS